MSTSELKKEARQSLKGKWGKAVCITLIFLAISMYIGFAQGLLGEGTVSYNILEVLFFIINVPLSFGLLVTFMKLKRGENVSVFAFFKEGFSRFGKSWGIWFHTFIRVLLPIICLALIIVLYCVFILVNSNVQLNAIFSIIYLVLLISTAIYIACRVLLYVIAYNISYDNPELTSKECVTKSEELMKGNRGNYFMLELSFIGWFLTIVIAFYLTAIILSIQFGPLSAILPSYLVMIVGMLFLMPYMQVAAICFYERVINNKKAENIEE